jgi:Flp pilus assembly protein TadG
MKMPGDLKGQAMKRTFRICRAAAFRSVSGKARPIGGRLRSGDEGQALVEFAMVMPLLVLLTMGLFMFGIYIANYQMLLTAVNSGGMALSRDRNVGAGTGDPCLDVLNAMKQSAPTLNLASLTNISITMNGNTAVTGTGSSFSCSSDATEMNTPTVDGNVTGGTVSVSATYSSPCHIPNFFGLAKIACQPLSAQITEYEF